MTVLLVTDPRYAPERIEAVVRAAAVLGDRFVVQLRDKGAASEALLGLVRRLRPIAVDAGARFVVNCRPRGASDALFDVLAESGVDSVHVPCAADAIAQARARFSWISVPVHADDELTVAAAADAILVSPIFETPGKGPARGTAALAEARALSGALLRVFALGGVDPERAVECAAAGADGVAVIRALMDAGDPEAVAQALEAPFR